MATIMKYELSERFAKMWINIRRDAGLSQEAAARHAGVSKKTIQNWEDGTATPSLLKASQYGAELGINLFPYYIEVFYPNEYKHTVSDMTDKEVDVALFSLLEDMPTDAKRKLLFLMSGKHGSSPFGLLERAIAYVHLPLRERVSNTFGILSSYRTAEAARIMNCPNDIKPNTDVLELSLDAGMKAVMNGKTSYYEH